MRDNTEEYLRKISTYLTHIPIVEQGRIISEIKEEISKIPDSSGRLVATFGEPKQIANRYLLKNKFKESKVGRQRNNVKIFFLILLLLIIMGIISILLLVKSFLPIFNFNAEDGTLELFGSKVILEQDSSTYFHSRSNKKRTYQLSGELNLNIFNQIDINSQVSDFLITGTNEDVFKYNCKSSINQNNPPRQEDKKLVLKFLGDTQCTFEIPRNKRLQIRSSEGTINMKNLKQDMDIYLGSGFVSWKQEAIHEYKLDLKSPNDRLGKFKVSKPLNPKYSAKIRVETGSIKFR